MLQVLQKSWWIFVGWQTVWTVQGIVRIFPFSVFLRKGTLEGYGKTSVDVVIPNSKIKKTLGFAAHTSRLHPSKSRFAEEKKLTQGELPKYFNPSTHPCHVSSREKRLEDRKRRAVDEKCLKPKKRSLTEKDICFVSDDAALLNHNYCHLLRNDKGTQTDFPYEDLEV